MSTGLVKPKEYKFEDSNIALLGSDLNHKVRQAAAGTEAAWKDAGKSVGLLIWRIEKFKVVPWPKANYGSFYDGDAFILLNTFKEKPDAPKLNYDLHFWLGKFCTQDEAGTAAYKTVELDDLLNGAAHQHREVMGYESELFLGYFGSHLRLMGGGVGSGFNHVEPEKYTPRLMHIRQTIKQKHVRLTQVDLVPTELCEGDVFILDAGLQVYQFNGKGAHMMAKRKGGEICQTLKEERKSLPAILVVEQDEKGADNDAFWKYLGGGAQKIKTNEEGRKWEKEHKEFAAAPKRILIVSDETGKMEMKLIAEGKAVKRSVLNSKHINIFDSGSDVWVWIGKGSDQNERKTALGYAQQYLTQYKRPAYLPLHRIYEGGLNETFESEIQSN